MMALNSTGDREFYLGETCVRYLPTGHAYPDQISQDDFEVHEGRSPGLS